MPWPKAAWLALIVLSLAAVGASARDSVVIYRCTDAAGAITVQNDVPCPKGQRQERRVIQANPPVAVPYVAPAPNKPEPSPAIPAPVVESVAPAVAATGRLPPPALFECRTWDDARYLSDDGSPPERCAPLQTTGVGGAAGAGAGAACEMIADRCEAIAEQDLCEGWHRRLREAEAALRFGRFESREAAQAEVERVARIAQESTCAR